MRDLFYNGFLDRLRDAGATATIFTDAIRVKSFIQEWRRPGVEFADLLPCHSTKWRSRMFSVRRQVAHQGNRMLLRAWIAFEERRLYPPCPAYADVFRCKKPDLLLATHAHLIREQKLISTAHAMGVPTLGVVRSWDNVHKGIRSRPQRLAVWNEINRQEVIEMEAYRPDEVDIVGPSQFDPYYDPETVWPRERLAARFALDPNRPILLFATLGYFIPGFDETCWMDSLLRLIDTGAIPGRPQIICRLHPWSRLEHFQRYAKHPDVRISYVDRYWPALTWYMMRDDVVVMANMLAHADCVITPGSTVTLKAAIFDRPTVVPLFHTYQPEQGRAYFDSWVLGKHFGRIQELDLVPFVYQEAEFSAAIRRCLQKPQWYHRQRRQLVHDYVTFTDGRSTDRLADLALSWATDPSRDLTSNRSPCQMSLSEAAI